MTRFSNEGGAQYLEQVDGLTGECQIFLDSIVNLKPLERVIEIQKFIQEHSFYDAYDNLYRDEMNNAGANERINYMQTRLSQLRNELGDEVNNQIMFAGVCADFCVLGEAMLRASGIPTGVLEGYNVNGNKFDNNNAHGQNVIFWPDQNGKNAICQVEMTPSAVTKEQIEAYELLGIKPKKLEDEIKESEIEKEEKIKKLKENLESIEKELDELGGVDTEKDFNKIDVAKYRKTLSDFINATFDLEDTFVFKRMLETYEYSPVHNIDDDNINQKLSGIKFMKGEYSRWNSEYSAIEKPLERIGDIGQHILGLFHKLNAQAKIEKKDKEFQKMLKNMPEYLESSMSKEKTKLWLQLGKYYKLINK